MKPALSDMLQAVSYEVQVASFELALGSLYELETQVLIVDKLEYGEEKLRASILKNIDEEQKMVMSFIVAVGKV